MQGSCFRKGYFGTTDKAVAVSGRDQLVYLAMRGPAMTDTPCLWPQTFEKTLARSLPKAYRCGRRGGEFSS